MGGSTTATQINSVTANSSGGFIACGNHSTSSMPVFAIGYVNSTPLNFTGPFLANTTPVSSIVAVAQYQGKFVAVGNAIPISNTTYGPIYMTSSDGSTWTAPALMGGSNAIADMIAITVNSSGLFVAITTNGYYNALYATSLDGSTWTIPSLIGSSEDKAYITSVTVNSSGLFVAVGYDTTGNIKFTTSPDGFTWSIPDYMFGIATKGHMRSVTHYDGLFVAVGYDIDTFYPLYSTSTNGSTWTTLSSMGNSTSEAIMIAITVNSSGLFVAVGYDLNYYPIYATSTNGSTWTTPFYMHEISIREPIYISDNRIVVNSAGLFFVLGSDNYGNSLYSTSSNGSTWTPFSLISNNNSLNFSMEAVAVNSAGLFVTVGNSDNGPTYAFASSGSDVPCFKEGTTVLCLVNAKETYLPIEQVVPGTLVKTSLNGYKKVKLIGKRPLENPGTAERNKERIYVCSTMNYPQLKQNLYITGGHAILVDSLTEKQRKETIDALTRIFVTDRKYRLIAAVDERAEPWVSEGTYNVWHFALEHENRAMNYGVYVNGGLLVESASLNCMMTRANMC